MQDPCNDAVGHFAWIKNLSRLMSRLVGKKTRNFSAINIRKANKKKTVKRNSEK